MPDRSGVFGPTDRAWTGEAGNGRTGASRKSFRNLDRIALLVVAILAERQASDSWEIDEPVFALPCYQENPIAESVVAATGRYWLDLDGVLLRF